MLPLIYSWVEALLPKKASAFPMLSPRDLCKLRYCSLSVVVAALTSGVCLLYYSFPRSQRDFASSPRSSAVCRFHVRS